MENDKEIQLNEITVPTVVVQDQKLTPRDKISYGIIHKLYRLHGECREENKKIAEIGGSSVSSVKRSLPELENNDYIRRIYRDTESRTRDRIVPLVVSRWGSPDKSKSKEKESNQRKHQSKVPFPSNNKTSKREKEQTEEQRKKDKKKKKKKIRKEFIQRRRNQIAVYYKDKIQPKAQLTDKAKNKIETRLKEYSASELRKAIDNFAEDNWWMENNSQRGMSWFFHSEDRIERFLLLDKGQQTEGVIEI